MAYVHGHAACVRGGCPMFGVNQAECCDGETAGCVPTSVVRGGTPPEPRATCSELPVVAVESPRRRD
jgi:hypothetical protein